MICLFALLRLVSHPVAQNRVADYLLMAVMLGCGTFLLISKIPQNSDTK